MVLVAVTDTAEERDGCSGVSKVVVASGIDASDGRRCNLVLLVGTGIKTAIVGVVFTDFSATKKVFCKNPRSKHC